MVLKLFSYSCGLGILPVQEIFMKEHSLLSETIRGLNNSRADNSIELDILEVQK